MLGGGEWTAGSGEGHGRRAVKVKCVYIMHGDGSSDMTVGEERWPSTVNHLDSWRTSTVSPLKPEPWGGRWLRAR